MQIIDNETNQTELRTIKTARTEKAINEAAEQGFRPLVKPVVPSPDIKSKYAVIQNKETGKITVVHDYRQADIPLIEPITPELLGRNTGDVDSNVVISWTYFYPYNFKSPFAAYLVPPDLQVGETVMLEDLIEDIVGSTWNQGDTYRLKSCKAVWDGKEFILQHNPDKAIRTIVG
jgi:hypothetical protein